MQELPVKIAVKYSRVSTNKQDLRGSKDGQEAEIDKFALQIISPLFLLSLIQIMEILQKEKVYLL